MYNKLIILLFIVGLAFQSKAQDSIAVNHNRSLAMGFMMNAYRGDLINRYDKWSPGFQVALSLGTQKRVHSEVSFSYGFVSGQNPAYTYDDGSGFMTTPSTFFNTSLLHFSYNLRLNLLNTDRYKLFVSQGLGLLRFNPRNDENQSLIELNNTRPDSEEYGPISFTLPWQAGFSYKFLQEISVFIIVSRMNQSTRYIDNVSEWSDRSKNDRILSYKLGLSIPLR